MAETTRNIGLSLGADICWPAAYEEILGRLDLRIPYKKDTVRFVCDRVTVEPFDLQYESEYDVVLDRITHWFPTTREWVKKIALMDGVYVLNNPWAIQAMEKHTTYAAMMKLGFPIPTTWVLPPKEYANTGDQQVTVQRYNRLFDLAKVGEAVGYPAFIKPYDGGGWVGVKRVKDEAELRRAYDESGERMHHLQAAVKDWDLFVRAIGIGPQVHIVKYDPDQPLHDRYRVDFGFLDGPEWLHMTRVCRVINAFFNWDFNSCEALRAGGVLHPIDFANACPDSQVTSLHFHFPWLVKALLRWSIFCATIQKKPNLQFRWEEYFEIAKKDMSFADKLERYDLLAKKHMMADEFEDFQQKHLGHLDEVALEFFQSARFKGIVREKVTALYPAHEVDQFTDHFFGMVQFWCKTEADRLGAA